MTIVSLTNKEKNILSCLSLRFDNDIPIYNYKSSYSYCPVDNIVMCTNSKDSKYMEKYIDIEKLQWTRDLNRYPVIIYEDYYIKNHCIYDVSLDFVQEETYGEGPHDCGRCAYNMRRNNNIFKNYCAACFHTIEKRIIDRYTRKTI